MDKLPNIGLPKWPLMYVTGIPITKEQAKEIIKRTDNFLDGFPSGNNDPLIDAFSLELGIPRLDDFSNYDEYSIARDEFKKKINFIDLNYVDNNWFSSAFIEGAYGWCHPNGKIGYSYNIGKWPTLKEVYEDWRTIAKEFPFLDVGITLYNGEDCDEKIKPLVSMKIKNGKIVIFDPEITDVHKGHEFEECTDYTIDEVSFNYNGEEIKYTEENKIPFEFIKEWAKELKEED